MFKTVFCQLQALQSLGGDGRRQHQRDGQAHQARAPGHLPRVQHDLWGDLLFTSALRLSCQLRNREVVGSVAPVLKTNTSCVWTIIKRSVHHFRWLSEAVVRFVLSWFCCSILSTAVDLAYLCPYFECNEVNQKCSWKPEGTNNRHDSYFWMNPSRLPKHQGL